MTEESFGSLVNRLTETHRVTVERDDGTEYPETDGLLQRMRQAIFVGMEGGGSGSAFGAKLPMDAGAYDLDEEITYQAAEALVAVTNQPVGLGEAEDRKSSLWSPSKPPATTGWCTGNATSTPRTLSPHTGPDVSTNSSTRRNDRDPSKPPVPTVVHGSSAGGRTVNASKPTRSTFTSTTTATSKQHDAQPAPPNGSPDRSSPHSDTSSEPSPSPNSTRPQGSCTQESKALDSDCSEQLRRKPVDRAFDFHEKGPHFGGGLLALTARVPVSASPPCEKRPVAPPAARRQLSRQARTRVQVRSDSQHARRQERDTTPDVTSERPRDGVNREGAIMPAEKFWPAKPTLGKPYNPALIVAWGAEQDGVEINGVQFDRSALNRLVRVVRGARDRTYERDE
jgi:hypothetical protein